MDHSQRGVDRLHRIAADPFARRAGEVGNGGVPVPFTRRLLGFQDRIGDVVCSPLTPRHVTADAILEAEKPPPKHHWYDSVTDFASSAWDVVSSNPMETVHTALDVVGFIPVVGDIADGVNALIYLGEGDWQNAALSGIAIVPVLGSAATAGRLGTKGVKLIKGLRAAEDGVEALDTAADTVRAGRNVTRGVESADEIADAIGESRAALNRAQDARNRCPRPEGSTRKRSPLTAAGR